jgi:hypothetical protein
VAQLARVKGTRTHRALGYTWVGLMLFVALSSFLIHELGQWGNFSLIHLLSVFSLAMLPLGIYFVRQHNAGAPQDHAWLVLWRARDCRRLYPSAQSHARTNYVRGLIFPGSRAQAAHRDLALARRLR